VSPIDLPGQDLAKMTKPDYSHHFSAKNIPFGIGSSKSHASPQCVTRIENKVIFLQSLVDNGFLNEVHGLPSGVFGESTLNSFAALPKSVHNDVRGAVQRLHGSGANFPDGTTEDISEVTMHLPVTISDFTGRARPHHEMNLIHLLKERIDFSCSLTHVQNAGRIIVNDERPPPAFFHLPICYAGRASSIVASGTPIQRPTGQFYDKSAPMTATGVPPVVCGPSRQMDYELEFAAIVGKPLAMNQGLNAKDADEHIFGFVILNDWSGT
jgi:fumarylacetoacetase